MKFYYFVSGTVESLYTMLDNLEFVLEDECIYDKKLELKNKKYSAEACISFIIDSAKMSTSELSNRAPSDLHIVVRYMVNGVVVYLEKQQWTKKFIRIDEDKFFNLTGTMLSCNTHVTYNLEPFDDLEHYEMILERT